MRLYSLDGIAGFLALQGGVHAFSHVVINILRKPPVKSHKYQLHYEGDIIEKYHEDFYTLFLLHEFIILTKIQTSSREKASKPPCLGFSV